MPFTEAYLPNQHDNMRLGPQPRNPFAHEEALFSLLGAVNGVDYSDLNLEVPRHMPVENMASNPVSLALLRFLITLHRPRYVLEIGSFIGASAIKMAQVMPYGGNLFTIEKGQEFFEVAARNVQANKTPCVEITMINADALSEVHRWVSRRQSAELVYLDADKDHYDEYLEPLEAIINPGGLLVVDDCFFHGDVLNQEPATPKGQGVKRLLGKVREMSWPKVLLPIANGVLILQKPGGVA